MAVVVSMLGMYASVQFDLPTGATIVCTFGAVLIVMAVLALGVLRQRSADPLSPSPISVDPAIEKRATWIVAGSIAITVILLFVMLVASYVTSHKTAVLAASNGLKINVYGHEWWWEVEYPDEEHPYRLVRTANEIHVPAGTVIDIHETSRDVIHSFWAPNIHGKKDLLPGYWNDLSIEVDKPGTWRGQCAEFCGLQHAHMGFYIVAQSRGDFDNWFKAQLQVCQLESDEQVVVRTECFAGAAWP